MTHLVLLGAGHAHVEVLRRLARRPQAGLRLTLITAEARTAYSGLLPALLRGECSEAAAHIAVEPLARAAGAALVVSPAVAIDLQGRHVLTRDGGFCGFDLLSIDIGGASAAPGEAVAVKPIGGFLERLRGLEQGLRADARIAVVGNGAGGSELAIALAVRLAGRARIALVGPDAPLAEAPRIARAAVAQALHRHGVEAIRSRAGECSEGMLALDHGAPLPCDAAIWATGIAAPALLARAGLACGPDGSVLTDAALRSLSHDFVFAAGDCARLHHDPRPKAGVWAVRAGPMLADNLRAAAAGRPTADWQPPREALAILGLGDRRAVAWRGGAALSGRVPYLLKAWIDRRWMARYQATRP